MDTRRPLKRAQPKLGPPDIYPQDPKQKEDELTSVNVKQGYTSTPLVSGPATLDEFGSAKNANIDAFGVYFSALLSEKHRINTLKDTQTKKQLVNTKEIWYVHAKTKHAVDNWFRDLANGTKTLGQLGKRIPIFNSKEGMFAQLYESHVPFSKAVWFIKMSAVHAIALSESSSKSKKRQVPDQYQELTAALTKYLKEISMRMFELYQQSQHSLQQIQQQQQLQSQQQQGTQLTNSQQHMQTSQISQQPPSQQQAPTNLSATSSSSNQQTSLVSTGTNPQSILLQRNAFKSNQQTPPKPASSLLASTSSSVVGSSNQPQQRSLISNHNFYRQPHSNQQQLSHFESPYSANSLASSLLNHISNFTANQHTSVATIMTSHITSASALSATTLATLSAIHEDFQNTFGQWQYQTQLARYLFDEGLLDRYDFLCFLLELIEKKRPINEMLVKFILPFILEYVIDFSRSAVLSRRLAHVCAKKLCQAMHHHPMSARSIRRNELAHQQQLQLQQQQQQQQQQSDVNSNTALTESSQTTSSTTTGKGFNLGSLSDARNAETNPAFSRNASSNNSHSAATSILDIVKGQLIDGHGHLCDELVNDQENNESNLYRNAIYILSSILQVICIECPTAMVRHHIIDAKFPPTLQGSPLDHLPCLPSSLPMMESDLNFELRRSIHDAEREILQRSAMADAKWSCNNSSKMASPKAALVNRLLTVLDILDKHNFDKIDPIDSHDLLYSKIFPSTNNLDSTTNLKTTNLSGSNDSLNHGNANVLDLSNHNHLQSATNTEHSNKKSSKSHQQSSDTHNESDNLPAHHFNPHEEKHVVKILCEWAITTQRTGEHRASVVARLLERRQSDLQAMGLTSIKDKKVDDLKSTTKSENSQLDKQINSPQDPRQKQQQQEEIIEYTFQNLLVQFLDEHAPVIDENQNDDPEIEKAFYNLVLLFGELIRCDVFSHHNYMCTLISRGMFNDLSKGSISTMGNTDGLGLDSPAPGSNYNAPGSVKPPRSAGREPDSLMTNPLQEFNPLSVSTNPTYQSNQLDAPDNKGLGESGGNQSSLRSLGFSPVLSQSNEKGQSLLDNHIDDVDADLGKILQDIKEGQQDEAADILLPDYLGSNSSRDDNANKNSQINKLSLFNLSDRPSSLDTTTQDLPNVMSASSGFPPNSVESTKPSGLGSASIGADTNDKSASTTSVKSLSEYRHMMFVKHFPVPDDESFLRDNNQRNILLHGFGKKREDARHAVKKLNREINKMFGRRASRDINDGGRVKKLAIRDGFSPETALSKFESLSRYDQHVITNTVATTVLEMFTGVSNGQTFLLPTLESISFVFDLFSIASNITGLLERTVPILEELPDVEAQIKLKCPLLSHQYTHSIALCIIGMLYRYHSCVLLLPREELCSIFESLHKLVAHIQNPAYCMTSTERVIFNYLFDLYSSQTGKVFDQFSGIIQKIKQARQSTPPMVPNTDHEWTPTVLSNIVSQLRANHLFSNSSTNPILNASAAVNSMTNFGQVGATDLSVSIRQQLYSSDSPTLRHLTESPSARYKFVCDAIFLSATSPYPDLVNDIAVLCADLTAKCPALVYDWIQALQALCCSAQRELSYRQLLNKINISDPQVMNNIAVFTAILVARRCLELDAFIIECAIAAILAPLGQAQAGIDKQYAEPGVRLTCHLLLTLFRNRDTTASLSCKQQLNSGGQNIMSQPYYGCGTPSYSGGMMGGVPQIGLLQSIGKVPDGSGRGLYLKYLCDHHLLRSACCSSKTQCHITLLKAIRVLAVWATPSENPDVPSQNRIKVENHFDDISADGVSNQLACKDLDTQDSSSGLVATDPNYNLKHINLQTASLHQFAEAILRLLSSQRWLHDKCLSDSELFTTTDSEKNILLDPKIDVKQSQRLLYLICYNKSPEKLADVGLDDPGSDQIASIVRMFENLDVWSMRLSLLRLQFMFAFCKSQSSVMLNDWLDNLARAVVDFFQKASQEDDSPQSESQSGSSSSKKNKSSSSSSLAKNASPSTSSYSSIVKINKVWLIEPLLDKLTKPPSAIHSKIIKASAALMESASVRANSLPSLNQTYLSTAAASTKFKERTLSQRGSGSTNPSNLASTSLLGFQPFLSLLLSCLKNQDKERETLLTSLNSQLYQAIHEKVDDIGYKQSLQDGLELRLCLIGQMFDTIQKSPSLTSDWATLLLLLVMSNLVDPQVDYGLYVSVLDMLAMLIHSAYVSDPIEQREESKKQYQNLMKKFRKELAALEEKSFLQMKLINPLMPLVRQMTEVITCEPMGSLVDTKGEKIEDFFSIDKKKGLKVSELQEVSPWDLIEGHKNPAPLSWPWFGAVRLESKPLRADENNRLMAWHTHTIHHNTAHYCQAPNTEEHHGPPSAKRSHTEKKPSQSNPLLKSLIEANDDSSPLNKSRDSSDMNGKSSDDSLVCLGDFKTGADDHYIGREDLIEDFCEMPVDLLFDSGPVETMIEDIRNAMQTESAVLASRIKPVPPAPAPPSPAGLATSSVLAAPGPHLSVNEAKPPIAISPALIDTKPRTVSPMVEPKTPATPMSPMIIGTVAASPKQQHLTQQHHTASPSPRPLATPQHHSTPPPPLPPLMMQQTAMRSHIPRQPPPQVMQQNLPQQQPMMAATPAPPTRNMSPSVRQTGPKKTYRKKATKKDTLANAVANQQAPIQPPNPTPPQISIAPQLDQVLGPPVSQPPVSMGGPQPRMTAMIRRGAGMRQQQQIVQPPPPQMQQSAQQQQAQAASVYDFPGHESSNQFVARGPSNSFYEQSPHRSGSSILQPPNQRQQSVQMSMQHQVQHQHQPTHQSHHAPHPHPPSHQQPTQQQQQHPHQHSHQLGPQHQHQPHQHQHQQPQQQQHQTHTHPHAHPHQQQQPQQQQHHYQQSHQQHQMSYQQHHQNTIQFRPQQQAPIGHQQPQGPPGQQQPHGSHSQHQHAQQQMFFQPMQQQQPQQPQQQQQQQIYTPQQTSFGAGHSRPALTAMLNQKHAAAGNMHQGQQRFNFN